MGGPKSRIERREMKIQHKTTSDVSLSLFSDPVLEKRLKNNSVALKAELLVAIEDKSQFPWETCSCTVIQVRSEKRPPESPGPTK